MAFPQQNIYNHLFQPLWKAPQKKCYGASNYYGKLHKKNKLQKLEDALIEQMLTAADLADRGDRGDQGDHGDWGDRRNGQIC